MIKHYVTIAIRSLLRSRLNSLINIVGLAIGLTVFILLSMFSLRNYRVDEMHTRKDRIYTYILNDNNSRYTTELLPPLLMENFDGIENYVCTESMGNVSCYSKENEIPVKADLFVADTAFFKIFDFRFIQGNSEQCLLQPESVVITREIAMALFGDTNILGEELCLGNDFCFPVTGVIENIPDNSSLDFDMIVPFSYHPIHEWTINCPWNCFNVETYLLLEEGTDAKALEQVILDSEFTFVPDGRVKNIRFLSLKENYFSTDIRDNTRHANLMVINGLLICGIFILVLAIINYLNLATAASALREREIALKRVVGSRRTQLVYQFLAESFVISFIAILSSIVLCNLFIPGFNRISSMDFDYIRFDHGSVLLLVLLGTIIIGLLAGFYPAFYLSRKPAVKALNGETLSGKKASSFRKTLIVVQMFISTFLIISSLIVVKQMRFVHQSDLGFDKSRMLTISMSPEIRKHIEAFKSELESHSNIEHVTTSEKIPGYRPQYWIMGVPYRGDTLTKKFHIVFVEADYPEKLGMRIKEGRFFDEDRLTDEGNVLLNETAVKEFDFEDVFDAEFNAVRGLDHKAGKVLGVVEDFYFAPMTQKMKPLVIVNSRNNQSVLNIRLISTDKESMSGTISYLSDVWKKFSPHAPFEYQFMEDHIYKLYAEENRMNAIFKIFTVLAIIITCLGLFGLSSFTVEQRKKEIAVRKVNGAGVGNVLFLLMKNYSLLILLAFVLASVPSYFMMREWLSNFEYKVGIDPWVFILSLLLGFFITGIAVSIHTIRAANANPAEVLRAE